MSSIMKFTATRTFIPLLLVILLIMGGIVGSLLGGMLGNRLMSGSSLPFTMAIKVDMSFMEIYGLTSSPNPLERIDAYYSLAHMGNFQSFLLERLDQESIHVVKGVLLWSLAQVMKREVFTREMMSRIQEEDPWVQKRMARLLDEYNPGRARKLLQDNKLLHLLKEP